MSQPADKMDVHVGGGIERRGYSVVMPSGLGHTDRRMALREPEITEGERVVRCMDGTAYIVRVPRMRTG